MATIHFFVATEGWAIGGDNFLHTTDGGQDVSPGGIVSAIDFIDANTGWTAGGDLKQTTDGGNTWVTQHDPQYSLEDISFADSVNGWAVGFFGTLLHTTDGGATWIQQDAGTGTQINFLSVSAISPTTAWITGGKGFVARTDDGGQTWTQELVSASINHFFTATEFLDENHGWVATQNIAPDGGIWFRGGGAALSPWQNLGFFLQGPLGIPGLDGAGPLTPGSIASLTLSNATPNAPALLVIGGSRADLPILLGSRLVPSPDAVLPIQIDGRGEFSAPFGWPSFPPGTSIYFHAWIADGFAASGWSGSTALQATSR